MQSIPGCFSSPMQSGYKAKDMAAFRILNFGAGQLVNLELFSQTEADPELCPELQAKLNFNRRAENGIFSVNKPL